MHKLLLLAMLSAPLAIQAASAAPPPAIVCALQRSHLDLGGRWNAFADPYDAGTYDYRQLPFDRFDPPRGGFGLDRRPDSPSDLIEYSFDHSPTLLVPGDWNSQEEKFLYYEGSMWYRRTFDAPQTAPDRRFFLYFGAANYRADVYLNGRKLGTHIGGFTPFNFEVTDRLKPTGNSLVVRVDNRRSPDAVPAMNTDWWNYGGLTREVRLIDVPRTFIADYTAQLDRADPAYLNIEVRLDGPNRTAPITFRLPELDLTARLSAGDDGIARARISAQDLTRWSPEHPQLYTVELVADDDRLHDRVGFRTVETRGTEILLNGNSVFLRGVCLHEENPFRPGRAWTNEEARMLLGWARELGCNFVRLAHYPHNEHMARVADEMGLMLWEEIPVYWAIQWENPATLANARQQLAELITRDRNRASVIVWSVANETPVSSARLDFLKTLISDARALDNTRLVSAAMEARGSRENPNLKRVEDPLGEFTDLISFNQYVGWYDGMPERCDVIEWETSAYEKPVFVSEFGAGALEGFHAEPRVRFSEEFQADVYRHTLKMLERVPNLRGFTPWILVDFRSPRRLHPHFQNNWNRKGLIGENGRRKLAFDILRHHYETLQQK